MTKSGKKLHLSHIKSLEEKSLRWGKDPFTLGYSIRSSSGEIIEKNVYNNMRKVEILGTGKLCLSRIWVYPGTLD